jgi:hypothetical protein
MWVGIIILGYFVAVLLLIRFLQTVRFWDDEIERMENRYIEAKKHPKRQLRPAP